MLDDMEQQFLRDYDDPIEFLAMRDLTLDDGNDPENDGSELSDDDDDQRSTSVTPIVPELRMSSDVIDRAFQEIEAFFREYGLENSPSASNALHATMRELNYTELRNLANKAVAIRSDPSCCDDFVGRTFRYLAACREYVSTVEILDDAFYVCVAKDPERERILEFARNIPRSENWSSSALSSSSSSSSAAMLGKPKKTQKAKKDGIRAKKLKPPSTTTTTTTTIVTMTELGEEIPPKKSSLRRKLTNSVNGDDKKLAKVPKKRAAISSSVPPPSPPVSSSSSEVVPAPPSLADVSSVVEESPGAPMTEITNPPTGVVREVSDHPLSLLPPMSEPPPLPASSSSSSTTSSSTSSQKTKVVRLTPEILQMTQKDAVAALQCSEVALSKAFTETARSEKSTYGVLSAQARAAGVNTEEWQALVGSVRRWPHRKIESIEKQILEVLGLSKPNGDFSVESHNIVKSLIEAMEATPDDTLYNWDSADNFVRSIVESRTDFVLAHNGDTIAKDRETVARSLYVRLAMFVDARKNHYCRAMDVTLPLGRIASAGTAKKSVGVISSESTASPPPSQPPVETPSPPPSAPSQPN
jgi:hypothetical protein